ncbi:hypothetical protein [Sphingobacterium psychroaquaticum]|uniref:Uncharacterized protein n=1 Tax=Sphingobacterium psychroaquaticum TaxID=561061 RepID=A0A1X7IZL3_9SPHI|nr:hypothetical protein [Sphingobacterium psychroaquaticum]SMG19918.1 hypothetical protein SAMN05660862_1182 [Sphingobacterium psychroaquaticum]
MDKNSFPTPSQFYRKQRPEYFSDSKTIAKVVLPKEQLDFILSQISTNQKHDNFETLCTKLAEKLIIPNLIPQVGPTGGGDGKTDSETYPVSSFISDRWFVGENKWNENENWAFAISAKSEWKSKVKSDVKKIIDTKRGYTKIFFFSNQKISSKNKKDVQDGVKRDYGIELVILDAEWILEKVYGDNLLNIVIETLNLSIEYLQEVVLGPWDIERKAQINALEERINSADRLMEVDFELIEGCLESAILSRMLERPKTEVLGRFSRALKFCEKVKNKPQEIRVRYQLAWTLINWYDEYSDFYKEYIQIKQLVAEEPNLLSIEHYFTLSNILRTISTLEDIDEMVKIDYELEERNLKSVLQACASDSRKPATGLLSKFYLSFIEIFNSEMNEEEVSPNLVRLKEYVEVSSAYIDLPFSQIRETIQMFGEMLPDDSDYDRLIDSLAEVEAIRVSELSSGQMYLKRGVTKLENNNARESLIYFGKAFRKLAKPESQDEFYFCLMLLSEAYTKLDLHWASYNSLIAALSIYTKIWYNTGNLNPRFITCVEELLKNQIIIGRIPIIMCWYELYNVVKGYSQNIDGTTDELSAGNLTDACLSVRLLNLPFDLLDRYTTLPSVLERNQLWLSNDALLYMLGHEDAIELDPSKVPLVREGFPHYFNKWANQPFKQQIAYNTDLMSESVTNLKTHLLGTIISVFVPSDTSFLKLGETILAYFESYLATAFNDVFPFTECITINISSSEELTDSFEVSGTSSIIKVVIKVSSFFPNRKFEDLIRILSPEVIGKNFAIQDYKEFFQKLYEKDEVNERLSTIFQHDIFLDNILTNSPKFFQKDWISERTKEYPKVRTVNPIIIDEEVNTEHDDEERENKFDNATHRTIKAETVINSTLWDKATWRGVGFFALDILPLGIFLGFENVEAAKEIFEEWITIFGKEDKSDTIMVSVIKGIDKNNPYWYKVLISKKMDEELMKKGHLLSISSRFRVMEAENDINLRNLTETYKKHGKYLLVPAFLDDSYQPKPFFNLGILKSELKIINAWEVGLHDIERTAITDDDDPIIPSDQPNAPILEVLKFKRNRRK